MKFAESMDGDCLHDRSSTVVSKRLLALLVCFLEEELIGIRIAEIHVVACT